MAYFGPADRARQYFIDMGFEPANRQTTPDFLVAVTDLIGRIERQGVTNQPRTAQEFADRFMRSEHAKANREDIDAYKEEFVGFPHRQQAYKNSVLAEHSRNTSSNSYVFSTFEIGLQC